MEKISLIKKIVLNPCGYSSLEFYAFIFSREFSDLQIN